MKKKIIYTIILCLWGFAISANAQSIGLRFPDTTMVQGDTIVLPLMVDSTLTGEEVYSFNLEMDYSADYLEFVDVSRSDLTGTYGDFVVNPSQAGKLLISGAGGTALEGTGVLLYIHFKAAKRKYSGSTYVSLNSNSCFNEGLPVIEPERGYVDISLAPSISLSPNDAELLIGESQKFKLSGDTVSPFVYEVENPTVGSIDADGVFTALAQGSTRVKVTDANGGVGYTAGNIGVFGVQLSSPVDLSQWQGNQLDVPVIWYNESGSDVISGSFKFSYDDYYLSYNDFTIAGSLLDNAIVEVVELTSEMIMVSFASSQKIDGDSLLLNLHFDVSSTRAGSSYFNYSDILFNDNILGCSSRGRFQTISYKTIYISPSKTDVIAGETLPLNCSGGILPYFFETSDSTVATVSQEGIVSALSSGTVTFSVTDSVGAHKVSNVFTIYDAYVKVPDTIATIGREFLLPVYLGSLIDNILLEAFQMKFEFETPDLEFLGFETAGTLSQGWSLAHSLSGNELNVSAANTSSISTNGVLFYIRFRLDADQRINNYAYINVEEVLLNEGAPLANTMNGSITTVAPGNMTYIEDHGDICPGTIINDVARFDENYDTLNYTDVYNYDSIIVHRWHMQYAPSINILGEESVAINVPSEYTFEGDAASVNWTLDGEPLDATYAGLLTIELTFANVADYELVATIHTPCDYYHDTLLISAGGDRTYIEDHGDICPGTIINDVARFDENYDTLNYTDVYNYDSIIVHRWHMQYAPSITILGEESVAINVPSEYTFEGDAASVNWTLDGEPLDATYAGLLTIELIFANVDDYELVATIHTPCGYYHDTLLISAGGDRTYVEDYGDICPGTIINDVARFDEDYDTLNYTDVYNYDSIIVHRWHMQYAPSINILGEESVAINVPSEYTFEGDAASVNWTLDGEPLDATYAGLLTIELTFANVGIYELRAGVYTTCGYYYDTLLITVDSAAMNLAQHLVDAAVEVYPNPAKDLIYLSSTYEISTITIFNAFGTEVLSQKAEGRDVAISLTDRCHQGVHFVKILTRDNGEYYLKILIE